MATDVERILENLLAFYDFRGKTVIAVGSGGGQLAGYGRAAGKVIAVDRDAAAMDKLKESSRRLGLSDRFEYWCGDFHSCDRRGDVVLFEFCLHEMDEPSAAIGRATILAPDVVVLDHAPGSPWIYYGAEDERVERSWRILEGVPAARRSRHETVQRFRDFGELEEKVRLQGAESLRRIEEFRGRSDIVIPMTYALALVQRPT
jgi:ubiquinone/menaquinone biosynthesis C-methylase UbiE